MTDIPHTPWFIRARPTDDGQAIIENGTLMPDVALRSANFTSPSSSYKL